jgi:hypothetical protein
MKCEKKIKLIKGALNGKFLKNDYDFFFSPGIKNFHYINPSIKFKKENHNCQFAFFNSPRKSREFQITYLWN